MPLVVDEPVPAVVELRSVCPYCDEVDWSDCVELLGVELAYVESVWPVWPLVDPVLLVTPVVPLVPLEAVVSEELRPVGVGLASVAVLLGVEPANVESVALVWPLVADVPLVSDVVPLTELPVAVVPVEAVVEPVWPLCELH